MAVVVELDLDTRAVVDCDLVALDDRQVQCCGLPVLTSQPFQFGFAADKADAANLCRDLGLLGLLVVCSGRAA